MRSHVVGQRLRSVVHGAHHTREIVEHRFLQQIGGRAGFSASMHVLVAVVRRQHDDLGVSVGRADPPDGLEAAEHRQLQIHQRDVRRVL